MASEGNFTVHHFIHTEDLMSNVQQESKKKKEKKKKKTILMRYAEQLSSNKTSNSLPSSNSMASQASEMLQNLG